METFHVINYLNEHMPQNTAPMICIVNDNSLGYYYVTILKPLSIFITGRGSTHIRDYLYIIKPFPFYSYYPMQVAIVSVI